MFYEQSTVQSYGNIKEHHSDQNLTAQIKEQATKS